MAEASRIYDLYQAGVNYNNRLEPNYYDDVDTNMDFFQGKQWRGLEMDEDNDLPQPVLNFIRRFVTFFVASLTTSNLKIHLSPYVQSSAVNSQGMNNEQVAEMVNGHIEFLLEKFKMEYKLREACFDSAVAGDACAHFYFDTSIKPYGAESGDVEGEIVMELVDGINVIFGNPNTNDVESQPYILIVGRDTIDNLRKEAIEHGMDDMEAESIVADSEYQYQFGANGQIENENVDEYGKALFIYCYKRNENGTISVAKSTPTVLIFDEVDTELQHYPIAWLNWEKQKNTYHGRSVVTDLIPTQIFINKMAAMIMYHLMMAAFPKIVYDENLVPDGVDNRVGRSIAVDNIGERPMNTIIDQIQPGNMSPQIIQALDTIVTYFKETAGISDASIGNVENPKNTSALIAVQEATSVPLGNPAANQSEFMESIGQILIDMMGTYYGIRPMVMKHEGQRVLHEFDFSQLRSMWVNVACDVGETTKYSELTIIQTLSNLLQGGYLDFMQFLERVPDGYVTQKQELIDELKTRMEMQQVQAEQSMQKPEAGGDPLASLSDEELIYFSQQPPEVQEQLLAQAAGV